MTIAKSSTNQEFIRPLGNRLRRAGDGRVKDGQLKGEPPYRYRLVPDWTCDREIDPESAKILQRIFTDYANLEPVRDIAAGSIGSGRCRRNTKRWNWSAPDPLTSFGSSRRMAAATS